MNDWTVRQTRDGKEWTVNAAGGTRDVELEYEYRDGYFGGTSRGYVFLNREDLVAMLNALDGKNV